MLLDAINTYTDTECFELIEERSPDTWREDLRDYVKLIIQCSHTKRVPAITAFKFTLKLFKQRGNMMHVMAAYYLIRTKKTMKLRTLQEVEMDITDFKHKLHINEISIKTQEDKDFTNEALVRKIYQLQDELELVKDQYQIDPNIEVTGDVVQADGSNEPL